MAHKLYRCLVYSLIEKGCITAIWNSCHQNRKEVKMGKNIHVVLGNGLWQVKQEKAQRSSGNYRTQKEAFERAREIAIKQGQEVAIHGKDGQIRAKLSYGNDPYPPKG